MDVFVEVFPHCFVSPDHWPFMTENKNEDRVSSLTIYPSKSGPASSPRQWDKVRVRQKSKLPKCQSCLKTEECEGIYRNYIKKRGGDEFRPIKKIPHAFIR
jgi:MoaA/NifB/PqqE/SkfB family radical SAM enzyme